MTAPERIWIDRGPNGGWMHRHEKLWDSRHEFVRTDLIQPQIAAARQDAKEAEAYAEELEQRLNTCRMATLVEAGSDVIRASNTLMLMLAGDIALTKAGLEYADHLGYWTEE